MHKHRSTPARLRAILISLYALMMVLMVTDLSVTRKNEIGQLQSDIRNTSYLLAELMADDFTGTQRSIDRIIQDLLIGDRAIVGVIDSTGTVRARKPSLAVHPVGVNDREGARRIVSGLTGHRILLLRNMSDGHDRWVSIRKAGDTGLFVYAADTTDAALGSWTWRLFFYITVYILTGIGFFFLYKYQARLLRSERKIRTLLDEISEIPVQGYKPDGTVLYWNKASETLYGYAADELMGRNIYEYIVPDENQREIRENAALIVATGQEPKAKLWLLKNKGGERFHILTHYILLDENPDEPQIFCFDVNMEPVMQARKQVESLLQEKETLLREVHHRIKNNMSTISGLLWLQSESLTDEPARQALLEAQGRVQNMMVLYNHLYRSDRFDSLSARVFVTDLVDRIQETLDPGGRVSIDLDAEDVHLDPKRLMSIGMILNELLSNVYKYAFPGPKSAGRVSVRLTSEESGGLVLTVSDNGPGLPSDVIDRTESGGFGMTLVSMLTQQLEGTLAVSNAPGARFEFRLPT